MSLMSRRWILSLTMKRWIDDQDNHHGHSAAGSCPGKFVASGAKREVLWVVGVSCIRIELTHDSSSPMYAGETYGKLPSTQQNEANCLENQQPSHVLSNFLFLWCWTAHFMAIMARLPMGPTSRAAKIFPSTAADASKAAARPTQACFVHREYDDLGTRRTLMYGIDKCTSICIFQKWGNLGRAIFQTIVVGFRIGCTKPGSLCKTIWPSLGGSMPENQVFGLVQKLATPQFDPICGSVVKYFNGSLLFFPNA